MSKKSSKTTGSSDRKSSTYGESEDTIESARLVSIELELKGEPRKSTEYHLYVYFDKQFIVETKWQNGLNLEIEELPMNLTDPYYQSLIADTPLIFLLRAPGGKGAKELDPLMHPDNRAGGNVDLSPLVMGQEEVVAKVPLLLIDTGEQSLCKVIMYARTNGKTEFPQIPLLITLLSAHCLPVVREGTFYIGALAMNGLVQPPAVNFGLSLSNPSAKKILWATASTGGLIGNTAYNVPEEDKFIPENLEIQNTSTCTSAYWNAMKRILVDPEFLHKRLDSNFLIELAGVPKTGKVDVRGRYMGYADAKVLLEPGQFGVTTCVKLNYYAETDLPENVEPLLDLPPASAKISGRDNNALFDEYGHSAYVMIRFDLIEPLIPKKKIAVLFEMLGFPVPKESSKIADELECEPVPEDNTVDVRRIRTECGALAVHKELSNLACKGAVPMNQGIKRTAANRLLTRVRTMLKQFPPGECSLLDWQDTVTAHHAASRRAVTASFRPRAPPVRISARVAEARCRMAGDARTAEKHAVRNLQAAGNHPRVLLSKALRLMEERNDQEARNCLLKALNSQPRNRFLLWAYGAQQFNKGDDGLFAAFAAFRISVKGDNSDGTGNAIGFAALHALYHFDNNPYAAFTAAKKMRKSYELGQEWKMFISRWINASGQEEIFWIPGIVSSTNPMLIAAAFFLCLRCYDFSEKILQCFEAGCGTRGSRLGVVTEMCPDVHYLRAASWLLQRRVDKAMNVIEEGINIFGPYAAMSQMRATCLSYARGWDGECESAFKESEGAGAPPNPTLLLQAALAGMDTNPWGSLQRAARAHQLVPSAHSALLIARLYDKMGEDVLAFRWASVAVKFERLLADGWAFLALLAMRERNIYKARTMLRTARQTGPWSPDIDKELQAMMRIVKVETLPDIMTKNVCFCDYV